MLWGIIEYIALGKKTLIIQPPTYLHPLKIQLGKEIRNGPSLTFSPLEFQNMKEARSTMLNCISES